LVRDVDYETPPGHRPTLSTFLLWVAKRRNMVGASLWVPVPFYLVATEDPWAWRKALDFLDNRLGLGLDFEDLDEEVTRQNERIAQARIRFPEIDDYIRRLEGNLGLTQEENEKLVKEIEELLRRKD
jgi:proteasome assembly chaperone (PAC2) family protein